MRIVAWLYLSLAPLVTAGSSTRSIGPLSVPFRLDSDGRACSGYLRVSAQELVWKSSWSTCHATSWRSSPQENGWLIELHGQTAEKKCNIHYIRIGNIRDTKDLWEVQGYASLTDLHRRPDTPVLGCLME